MLQSKNIIIYTLICDKCNKTTTVVCKNESDLLTQPFVIDFDKNTCICTNCAKKEAKEQKALEKNNKVKRQQFTNDDASKIFDDVSYEKTAHPLVDVVEHIRDSRIKDMISRRLNGETLNSIGAAYGITRERVRQLTTNVFSKFLVEEDTLDALYYFTHYGFLTKNHMMKVFNISEQVYYYYKCRFDRNMNTTKDDLFADDNLTEKLRMAFDNIFIYSKELKDLQWHNKAMKTYKYLFDNNPHNKLTVLDILREYSPTQKKYIYKALCQCECGNYTTVATNMVSRTQSCGCITKNVKNWLTPPKARPTKPVKCIETGKIYASMADASNELNINTGSISTSCKYSTAVKGYHFEYADSKYGRNTFECENTKKVKCIETGEIFNSVNEARRKYPSVSNILYGHIKSTKGYHFEFIT